MTPAMKKALERRRADLLEAELKQPLTTWWLSFADDARGGSLGVCLVEARGLLTAVMRTHQIGINPGGQVMGFEIPEDSEEHALPRDRLLKADELMAVGAISIRAMEEQEKRTK